MVSQFWLGFGLVGSGCSCCWVVAVDVRISPLGENVSQYKFSFLCTRRTWERRLSRRAERYAQWGHKCGFSPVCIRLCCISCKNQYIKIKQQHPLQCVHCFLVYFLNVMVLQQWIRHYMIIMNHELATTCMEEVLGYYKLLSKIHETKLVAPSFIWPLLGM